MSEIVVFLGPSLPLDEARRRLPSASFLPPVAMGDVYRVLRRSPAVIAIIDGLFEQTPSVWHKEILLALWRGVRVYGGASMGALRACELDAFGMIGVGSIYERFRAGVLTDDDEVAVAHGPADCGWRPTSEAMVNIRDGLALAVREDILRPDEAGGLIEQAKARFYVDRSWARVLVEARELGVPHPRLAELRELVRTRQPNSKCDDARAVLDRIAADRAAGVPASRPNFVMEHSPMMFTLLSDSALPDERRSRHPRASIHGFGRMLRATSSARAEIFRRCLYRIFLAREAVNAGIYPNWLEATEALSLTGGQLDDPELRGRVEREARNVERLLMVKFGDRLDVYLPSVLADGDELDEHLVRYRRLWDHVHASAIDLPLPWALGCEPVDLIRWYAERFGLVHESPSEHAKAVGLTLGELLAEAGAQYLFERGGGDAANTEPETS